MSSIRIGSRGLAGRVLFWIILMAILSGCFGSAEDKGPLVDSTTTGGSTGSRSSSPGGGDSSDDRTVPSEIAWNECHGLEVTFIHYALVADLDDGETPPGWEPPATQDGQHYLMVNECQRVSIGSFERGPVTFLIETHSRVAPPDSCRDFNAGYESMDVILGFWLDDPELADFLAETYGLPVHVAEFSSQVAPLPDGELHQWSWSAGDGESTIVAKRPGSGEALSPYLNRYVWHNGTGVSFLDLHEDAVVPYTSSTAEGVLAPPMKYAQGSERPYTGLSPIWNHADHYGPIFRFGDLECKELLG